MARSAAVAVYEAQPPPPSDAAGGSSGHGGIRHGMGGHS